MKKFLASIFSIMIALAMVVTAFAATNNFVSSPSAVAGPALADYSNSDSECKAKIVLTPYKDRNTLPDDKKSDITAAYDKIVSVSDLSVLSSGIKSAASKKNVAVADLAVSDLFDLSYYEDGGHDGHGTFTITISADSLENFVALVHCVGSDWEVIDNANVDKAGTKLTFKADDFSPFAIVVNNQNSQSAPASPQTSTTIYYGYIAAAVVFAGAAVCLFVFGKKKSAKA